MVYLFRVGEFKFINQGNEICFGVDSKVSLKNVCDIFVMLLLVLMVIVVVQVYWI